MKIFLLFALLIFSREIYAQKGNRKSNERKDDVSTLLSAYKTFLDTYRPNNEDLNCVIAFRDVFSRYFANEYKILHNNNITYGEAIDKLLEYDGENPVKPQPDALSTEPLMYICTYIQYQYITDSLNIVGGKLQIDSKKLMQWKTLLVLMSNIFKNYEEKAKVKQSKEMLKLIRDYAKNKKNGCEKCLPILIRHFIDNLERKVDVLLQPIISETQKKDSLISEIITYLDRKQNDLNEKSKKLNDFKLKTNISNIEKKIGDNQDFKKMLDNGTNSVEQNIGITNYTSGEFCNKEIEDMAQSAVDKIKIKLDKIILIRDSIVINFNQVNIFFKDLGETKDVIENPENISKNSIKISLSIMGKSDMYGACLDDNWNNCPLLYKTYNQNDTLNIPVYYNLNGNDNFENKKNKKQVVNAISNGYAPDSYIIPIGKYIKINNIALAFLRAYCVCKKFIKGLNFKNKYEVDTGNTTYYVVQYKSQATSEQRGMKINIGMHNVNENISNYQASIANANTKINTLLNNYKNDKIKIRQQLDKLQENIDEKVQTIIKGYNFDK